MDLPKCTHAVAEVVPGAAKLVKDVITVQSKILKEKQVIDIVAR
jgi:hypothetical protein